MGIRAVHLAAALAVVVAGSTACASNLDVAFDHAADEARAEAVRYRAQMPIEVPAGSASEYALSRTLNKNNVLGSRDTSGGYEIDAVLYGRGESGAGWTYESASVRMCVRFKVQVKPVGTVEIVNLECPSSLPTAVSDHGSIDRTVEYDD